MRLKLFFVMGLAASLSLPAVADDDDIVEVKAAQNLTIMRGTGAKPTKHKHLHPKTVKRREKTQFDRVVMIRFDSAEFGDNVQAVMLQMQCNGDTDKRNANKKKRNARMKFRIYAVYDGDAQDEKFDEKTYDPSAKGTIIDDSTSMLDRRQVIVLGTFTIKGPGKVKFMSSTLSAMARKDTNGTVTLIVTRLFDNGDNSTFSPRTAEDGPKLLLKLKEPKAKKADEAKDKADEKAKDEPAKDEPKDESKEEPNDKAKEDQAK